MSRAINNPVLVPPPCDIDPVIYAEYLPQLQQTSIVVELPTPSTWKTKVVIGKDSRTLHVFHEGILNQVSLPVPVALRDEHLALGYRNREQIDPGHTRLGWRLNAAAAVIQAAEAAAANGREAAAALRVPWSAADLLPGVDVACRECQAVIIGKDKIAQWKDLPSENWAEMMEFWHCHKPTDKKENVPLDGGATGNGEKKTSDEKLASRGYGANSAISAQSGVGFVDLTKFLFYGEDCRGLKMSVLANDKDDKKSTTRGTMMATSCLQCSTQLGHFEFRKNGFTLYKWAVALLNGPTAMSPRVAPPNRAQCISAALLEIQARDNSAKVVLQGNDKEAITIWVLNPHVVFSCLAVQRAKAIKVLFRTEAMAEAAGELELPDDVVVDIRGSLERSNGFLPSAEKMAQFGGVNRETWNVGLLQRL